METSQPVFTVRLQAERHVVHARQRARDIAALLGFDHLEQVRLATATSELARNAFRYAREGTVSFLVKTGEPQSLLIEVTDKGPGIAHLSEVLEGRYQSKTGMGKGLIGTRRLMDHFDIRSGTTGTRVLVGKALPSGSQAFTAKQLKQLQAQLARAELDPLQEVERQNQELLRTLAELREKQEMLTQLNRELEDTNRGVVALYAELEQNANDLRRISDLKTSFLSNLSHEFRTPLNAILSLCQILESRSDGDLTPEQDRQLGFIRRSAADLSELVNDLLDVAKVEAGKVDIKPAPFAIADLFGALRGMLRTLVHGDAVELRFSLSDDVLQIVSDEGKVSQILRNLISNALKFTERGHVHVSASKEGEYILFRVEDTGIGIAIEDQERVFEEFMQVEGEIQSRVRGTGLGLPLARRLAELLGGTLQLRSAPGVGSTFSAILPLRFERAADPILQPLAPSPDAPVVLIVEDNTETRFIHQTSLKASHLALQMARSLDEAKLLMIARMPDAIVLDRMLDGVDALPFLKELRDTGYKGKVVAVSVIDDAASAHTAGADAFIAKPIPPGALADTIARLLDITPRQPVLLVDDDEINRYVLRESLQPFGLRLLEAHSGREALTIAASTPLSCIFLDMSMPGFTGAETLRELRSQEATANTPVIIHTSAELSPEESLQLGELGASFFPKRFLRDPKVRELLRNALTAQGVL